MYTCKFCSDQISQGSETELNDPEVVLMLNFIKIEYRVLVRGEQISSVCPKCMNFIKTTYNFIMQCTKAEIRLRNCSAQNEPPLKIYPKLTDVLAMNNSIENNKDSMLDICRVCLGEISEFHYNFKEKCYDMPLTVEEMFKFCFSSTNPSIILEQLICDACVKSLIIAYSFYERNSHIMSESNKMISNEMHMEEVFDVGMTEDNVKQECLDNTQHPDSLILSHVVYVKEEPYDLDINEEVKIEDNTEHLLKMHTGEGGKPYRPVSKRYFCQTCSYTTKRKACLIKHKIVHFPDYKKPIFKCKDCGYTVKSQKYLDRHMSQHANGIDFKKFKCELCSFSTKKRSKLERHSTVHKDERDTIMYKCSKCMFITKWKSYLTQHELTHNETEEKKFKCGQCDFSTNWRGSLLQHKVVHLSGDDAFKFSCDQCPFKTKRKDNLSKHMIRHMKDEDVRIFYCSECPFTSKFSSKLARHMHVHKRGDELTVYNCTDCDFQTRWKNNLQQHMRVHQNASEIPLFKCKDCPFTTKWKTCLTEHEVMHKTGDDSKEYKCTECSFNTKWKKSLNMHLLTHTADDSIKKFKCDMCEYKTYRSHHLKRHMQVHLKYCKITI